MKHNDTRGCTESNIDNPLTTSKFRIYLKILNPKP